MNNLLDVLRGKPRWATTDEQREAADEIERLDAHIQEHQSRDALQQMEIERLKAVVDAVLEDVKDIEANYIWGSNERKIARWMRRHIAALDTVDGDRQT